MHRTLLLAGVTLLAGSIQPESQAGVFPVQGALTLWLSADAGVVSGAQGQVGQWLDQSGLGHDATQGDASVRPTLVPGALNGLPVVRFNGSQFMALAGTAITNQAFTILVVASDQRTDSRFREILSNWNDTIPNQGTSVFFGTTGFNPVRFRLSDDFGGAGQGQVGVGVVANPLSYSMLTGVNGPSGVSVFQGTTASASRPAPLATRNLAGPWFLGRQGNGTFDEYWRGDIAELVVFSRALSVAELEIAWGYLETRYAIAPPALTIERAAGGATLRFTQRPPYAYHLQATDRINGAPWNDLSVFPPAGQSVNVARDIPADQPERYYRLQVGP